MKNPVVTKMYSDISKLLSYSDSYFDQEYISLLEENAYDIFEKVHYLKAKYTDNCVMVTIAFDVTIIDMMKVHQFTKESCLPLEGICTSDEKIILTFCEHKDILQP